MCQPELGSLGSELPSDNPERICYTSNKFPGTTWCAEPAWFLTPVCSILRRERLSLAWLKRCMTDITSIAPTWPVQVDNTSQRAEQSCFGGFGGVKVPRRTPGEGVVWCRGPAKNLDSPTMIPQALTNPISFFRATPPPPELASASGLVSDPRPGWFFAVLFRCRVPFSIFLRRVPTTKS